MLRGLPRGAIPLVFVDANARFVQEASSPRTREAQTRCPNSEYLLQFCGEFSLEPSWQFSHTGKKLRSWVSPNGQPGLIDYVLHSTDWVGCVDTLDTLQLDDMHCGYDHFPVTVRCSPAHSASRPQRTHRIHWPALESPQGRNAAIQAWATMPSIPWDVDATTHVEIIHAHLRHCLERDLPVPASAPRNPIISAQTLDLIRERRHWKRCERSTRARFNREVLRFCFGRWADGSQGKPPPATPDTTNCGLICRRWFRGILLLNHKVGRAMSRDKATYFRKMMSEARLAGPSQWAHRIRAITRQGRRFRTPLVLPVLQTSNGPVFGRTELQDTLAGHFAQAEKAKLVTRAELLEKFRPRGHLVASLQAHDTPSIPALASGFASLQSKRAPGLSGLVPDLYKVNPMLPAVVFWPVFAKTLARGHTPAQYAGGLLSTVPKPGKSAEQIEAWRSILLLEAEAKAFQKTIRPDLVRTAAAARADFQYGGLPRLSMHLPSSLVRAHLLWLKHCNRSGGIVFVDVKTAYYAVVRDVLAATPELRQDAQFAASRAAFLFRDHALREQFMASLAHGDPLTDFGASAATIRFVQSHLGHTWYTARKDAASVYLTATGTAPGSPVADVLFAIVFRDFLLGVQEHLQLRGIHARIDLPPPVARGQSVEAAGLPAWADDACVMFQVDKARQVETAIAGIAEAICLHMQPLCLEPNFGAGKTEVVAVFNGAESRCVRRELLCDQVPSVRFQHPNGSHGHIRIVPQYPHLGALIRGDACELPNLRMRARAMWHAFHPIRRRLLNCGDLEIHEKVHLIRERILPRFLYQAGLWRLSTRQEFLAAVEPVRMVMRSALRPITGLSSRGVCNTSISALLGTPTAEEFLDCERCRALLELACQGSMFVWCAFVHDGVWLKQAFQSLDNVMSCAGHSLPQDLEAHSPSFRDFLVEHQQTIRQAGKAFLRTCIASRKKLAEELMSRPPSTADHSIWIDDSEDEILGDLVSSFRCSMCNATFDSQQKLSVHKARKHGRKSAHVEVATGTSCPVCMKEYWTLPRLQQHLKKSPVCLQVFEGADLLQGDNFCDSAPVSQEGTWRPVAEICGPRPFWAMLRPNMG